MYKVITPLVLVFLLAGILVGVSANGRAPAERGETPPRYLRRTPIVEAVQRTRNGVVTLKVSHSGRWSKRNIAGTGVIVDERGFVLTNHHVITEADKIEVTLADRTKLEARVHTEIASHDLAILRLPDDRTYNVLPLGPGGDLLVGETVIAIGNPYGFAGSVATGILSALDREITMPSGETLHHLIQHTALINPGNSGGPLFNINGELIGINVALREGAQGISFAINADTVKEVLSKHLGADRLSKVRLGFKCREVISDKGERQRVLIDQIEDPTLGLRKGDMLIRVGSLSIQNRFDVERALWGHKAGDRVSTIVMRNGQSTTIQVPLKKAEYPRP